MNTQSKRNTVKNGIAFTGKSWSYVLRVPDPVTGKTKPQWVGGYPTKQAALLARDEARVSLRKRQYVGKTNLTLSEYLDEWINYHQHFVKPTTLVSYTDLIRNYLKPRLGSIPLQSVTTSDIERFYTGLITTPGLKGQKLSKASATRIFAVLSKCLGHAAKQKLIQHNPAKLVELPGFRSTVPKPWTFSEMNTFLDLAKDDRLFFYFRLAAYTGARRGELAALRWSDFDGEAITINKTRSMSGSKVVEQNSTKGGHNGQRRVTLDSHKSFTEPGTIELLKAHKARQEQERDKLGDLWQDTGYMFTHLNGQPLDPAVPRKVFSRIIKENGLRPVRLYDLRHTHATESLRIGIPLHVVAYRLGHRDSSVTSNIYAHVDTEQDQTCVDKFANAARLAG